MAVIMCKQCAGAIQYDGSDEPHGTPETHADAGQECPTLYRE